MKRFLCLILVVLAFTVLFPRTVVKAAPVSNNPIPVMIRVRVDGVQYDLYAYNFSRLSYIKLRDLAFILNYSGKQFSIDFDDASGLISVNTKSEYTPIGTEMQKHSEAGPNVVKSRHTLLIDGVTVELDAFTIGGYNYYNFRDLAPILDFDTTWDSIINKAICINTTLNNNPDSQIPIFSRYYYYMTILQIEHDGTASEGKTCSQNDYDMTKEEMQESLNRQLIHVGLREARILEFEQCAFWKQLDPKNYPDLIFEPINGVLLTMYVDEYLAFVNAGMREESIVDCVCEEHYQEYLRDRNSGKSNVAMFE